MFKKLGKRIEKNVKNEVQKAFDVKIKVTRNKNVDSEGGEGSSIPDVSTSAISEVPTPAAPPEVLEAVASPEVLDSASTETIVSPSLKRTSRCEQIYKIKTTPKGKVFLVNNRDFEEDPLKPGKDYTRYGSESDHEKLQKLWTDIGFEVVPYTNLKKSDFEANFLKFVTSVKDCCVIIVMSHGTKAGSDRLNVRIKMSDNRYVELNWIFDCLHSENAPNLAEKPKVVILGCCRGSKHDMGYEKTSPATNLIDTEGDEIIQTDADRTGSFSDILLVYPGNPDLATLRHKISGSFFFQELISVMTEFWQEEHFLTMLNKVDINLKERFNQLPIKLPIQVVNHYSFGFSKYLYFFDKE